MFQLNQIGWYGQKLLVLECCGIKLLHKSYAISFDAERYAVVEDSVIRVVNLNVKIYTRLLLIYLDWFSYFVTILKINFTGMLRQMGWLNLKCSKLSLRMFLKTGVPNKYAKFLKNTCEEVQALVNLQGIGLHY